MNDLKKKESSSTTKKKRCAISLDTILSELQA